MYSLGKEKLGFEHSWPLEESLEFRLQKFNESVVLTQLLSNNVALRHVTS